MHVPSDPESFFSEYLRARLQAAEPSRQLTSVGSVLFRIPPLGEWSLRLREGELEITRDLEDDVMLQVTVPAEDFEVVVVEPLRVEASLPKAPNGVGALSALAMNAETARMVRKVPGSVLFVASAGEKKHRLLVTPGIRTADLASADCTIECSLSDVAEARERGLSPFQLFSAGKLRIRGNVQIAMALAAVFTK